MILLRFSQKRVPLKYYFYKRFRALKQANNDAYEEAVKLLQKIRELMGRLDRVTEFEDYLGALRVEYKRKRNFIKLLDTIESL